MKAAFDYYAGSDYDHWPNDIYNADDYYSYMYDSEYDDGDVRYLDACAEIEGLEYDLKHDPTEWESVHISVMAGKSIDILLHNGYDVDSIIGLMLPRTIWKYRERLAAEGAKIDFGGYRWLDGNISGSGIEHLVLDHFDEIVNLGTDRKQLAKEVVDYFGDGVIPKLISAGSIPAGLMSTGAESPEDIGKLLDTGIDLSDFFKQWAEKVFSLEAKELYEYVSIFRNGGIPAEDITNTIHEFIFNGQWDSDYEILEDILFYSPSRWEKLGVDFTPYVGEALLHGAGGYLFDDWLSNTTTTKFFFDHLNDVGIALFLETIVSGEDNRLWYDKALGELLSDLDEQIGIDESSDLERWTKLFKDEGLGIKLINEYRSYLEDFYKDE